MGLRSEDLGLSATCELIRGTLNTCGEGAYEGRARRHPVDLEIIEARVSIERKVLKKTARMLGVLACAGALLSACISPDLEPPGALSRTTPANPNAPGTTAATDKSAGDAASQASMAGAPNGTNPLVTKPSMMPTTSPSTTSGVAGAAASANPATGAAAPGAPGAAMAPPTSPSGMLPGAAGSTGGAAGAGASTETNDADAGVGTP